ncbi:MAG TPA: DUF2975 domain-containing protein [Verrucomicrobiae bacterium]|nr:DUF2975 domain-containing protein [Verrucomicrobiae bacterium]
MSRVERLYAEPDAEAPALRRIRHLSLPFELIFLALAGLVAFVYLATLLAALFYTGEQFRLTANGPTLYLGDDAFAPGSVKISDVPLTSRLIGFVPLTIIQGALIAAFYCLHKLFGGYRRGHVFTETAIRWMRRAGVALIVFAIAPGVFQPLVRAAGLRDEAWLHGHTIAALLIGGALFVLARVIALGRQIEEESKGYI